MSRILKTFDDPRLRRKMAVLRAVFLLLEIAVVAGILVLASSGEMLARGSLSGARADSRATLGTVFWSDSPMTYLAVTLWHIGSLSLFVGGFYLALAKLTEKFHGRPMFRRK